jgi:hypothetical protein
MFRKTNGDDITPMMRATEAAVKQLTRPTKRLLALLVVLCVVMAGVVGFLGYKNVTHPDTNALKAQAAQISQVVNTVRAGAISSCEATNARSAADIQHWDLFIGLLLKGQTNPTVLAEGHEVTASVAKSDAPRDCQAIYGTTTAPATTDAG